MKYAITSDLHLGQNGEYGFYSTLGKVEHSNKDWFIKSLNTFSNGDKLTLILNGDVLDLSLATFNEALNDFVELLSGIKNLYRIVYVVGNHDHHMWMIHSEHKKVVGPLLSGYPPGYGNVYEPTAQSGYPLSILEKYISKKLNKSVIIDIAYPSYTFKVGNKNVFVTHGHLFGGMYTLISGILKSFIKDTRDEHILASANMPVVEMVYWLIGNMGYDLGVDGLIEAVYADIEHGKKSKLRQLFSDGINTIFPKGVISWIPDGIEKAILKWIGRKLIEHIVKKKNKSLCSSDRHRSSEETRQQANEYIDKFANFYKLQKNIFVSGHTHVADLIYKENYTLYNTGSWLVEPEHSHPQSRILLLDDKIERFIAPYV